MNYWHMQLHPDEENWGREEELLKTKNIIGLGDWEEKANQQSDFENEMQIGDIVLIKSGGDKIAIVEITSNAYKESKTDDLAWFPNRRKINILEILDERQKGFPASRGTLQKLLAKNETRSYIIMDDWHKKIIRKASMQEKINLLKNRNQIILQGPPGTGKTRVAKIIAINMINDTKNQIDDNATNVEIKNAFKNLGDNAKLIQFHPSFSYEDFVRGISAKTIENKNDKGETTGSFIKYVVENKILAEMAKKADEDENKKPYILIIDEINRANLSSVLGELIYALEYRNEPVESMYELPENGSSREITLPSNLYIIGTMNTADRSIGHIDYAIRRRFAFKTVLPDEEIASKGSKFGDVKKIFEDTKMLSPEFEKDRVMLGHSYFIGDEKELKEKLKYQVIPLLEEYISDGVLTDSEELREIIKNL